LHSVHTRKTYDNNVPFLDNLVHLEDGRFQLKLSIKPTHSGTCLTFDSHAPLSSQKSFVISGLLRAERIASPVYFTQSMSKVTNRLHKNDYPQWLLHETIRRRQLIRPEQPECIDFLRIPSLSEIQRIIFNGINLNAESSLPQDYPHNNLRKFYMCVRDWNPRV
jgi:hypothetical protein